MSNLAFILTDACQKTPEYQGKQAQLSRVRFLPKCNVYEGGGVGWTRPPAVRPLIELELHEKKRARCP